MYLQSTYFESVLMWLGFEVRRRATLFSYVTPCNFALKNLVLVYFETSEPTHETTFHCIPEDRNLHIYWIILLAFCVLPALCTVVACSWSETLLMVSHCRQSSETHAQCKHRFLAARTAAHFKKPSCRSVLQQWTVHSDRSGQINKQMPFHLSQAANLDWKSAMEQGLHGLEEAYDEGGPNIHPDGYVKFWHIMLMNL